MLDQLWWVNKPVCLEWREEVAADETPHAFWCLVELVHRIYDVLAPTRDPERRANLRDARTRASIASGGGWQASAHRRNS